MITGDHPGTAGAIAGRLGILGDNGTVLTGRDLARLTAARRSRAICGLELEEFSVAKAFPKIE